MHPSEGILGMSNPIETQGKHRDAGEIIYPKGYNDGVVWGKVG